MISPAKVFMVLKEHYGSTDVWTEVDDELGKYGDTGVSRDDFYQPFKHLIIGILSQNTSDRNCTRAYIGLARATEITPQAISQMSEKDIGDAIRPGGLYNLKARRIKGFVAALIERYHGDASALIEPNDAEITRERVSSFKGIGPKTADVFVAYCQGYGVLPIDTHIARIAHRIGWVSQDASYYTIRDYLESHIAVENRLRAHELLIRFGRDICKAQKPQCSICQFVKDCTNPLLE